MMTVGDRIRTAREAKGLTQGELGKLCGTTKQNIYKYETGIISNIPLGRLEQIATALGLSASALMGWNEDNKKDEARRQLLEEWDRASPEQQQMMLNILRAVKNSGK